MQIVTPNQISLISRGAGLASCSQSGKTMGLTTGLIMGF